MHACMYIHAALADWTVSDVCEWLASKGLGQYAETFEANQIVGAVLTDLSLEDFDYMGITALGHRKILLKGIDELSQMKASKKVRVTYKHILYCHIIYIKSIPHVIIAIKD